VSETERLDEIAASARARGHAVEPLPEADGLEITVAHDDGLFHFYVYQTGDWIQARALLLDDDDLAGIVSEAIFYKAVAVLHMRCLGCRFGADEHGLFMIVDLYPNTPTGAVEEALVQMGEISGSVVSLLKQAALGSILTEADIDAAFALEPPVFAH